MKRLNNEHVDIAFINGSCHIIDAENTIAEAIAISGNKIFAYGTTEEIRKLVDSNTKEYNLNGRSLIPGINDSHNHAWEAGIMYDGVVLFGLDSIEKMQAVLADRAKKLGSGKWIQGGSYIESQFSENRTPNRYDLDKACPDNPVVLERIFGACVANSLALEAANITNNTPDPVNGRIVRDDDGEPTGLLEGQAVLLVRNIMPGPFGADDFGAGKGEVSIEFLKQSIGTAMEEYRKYGITSITEPGVSSAICRAYDELLKENKLKCRVALMPNWHGFTLQQNEEVLNNLLNYIHFEAGFGNDWIRFSALKMAIDGGLTSGTALKSWPYKGESEPRNVNLRLDIDKLDTYIKSAHDAGWDVGIHVMGDIAIDKAVTAMYNAIKANPRPHHHYIIHAYYPTEDALQKMSETGIMACAQGSFIYGEADGYGDLLTEDKIVSYLPLRSYLDHGIVVSLNTDMPCAAINPFWNMYSAVTRKGMRGFQLGTEECITKYEALRMMTYNGAVQNGEESIKGNLEPGKLADIAVLDRNFINTDVEDIKDIEVDMTIVDGKIIWER